MIKQTHPHPPESGKPKNTTQYISVIVGSLLCVLGAAGMLSSSFAGLHFTIFHGAVIFACGATLLYNGGFKDNSWNAFLCCLGFGLFFGIHSILGFTLGKPGVPSVGFTKPDPALFEFLPSFTQLGSADHVLNGVIALVLLGGALDWLDQYIDKSTQSKRHFNKYAHH